MGVFFPYLGEGESSCNGQYDTSGSASGDGAQTGDKVETIEYQYSADSDDEQRLV